MSNLPRQAGDGGANTTRTYEKYNNSLEDERWLVARSRPKCSNNEDGYSCGRGESMPTTNERILSTSAVRFLFFRLLLRHELEKLHNYSTTCVRDHLVKNALYSDCKDTVMYSYMKNGRDAYLLRPSYIIIRAPKNSHLATLY